MNVLDFINNNELYIIIILCVCLIVMLAILVSLNKKIIKLNDYYINTNGNFEIINDAINYNDFYSFTNFVSQVSRMQKELQELKEYEDEEETLEDLSKKYDKLVQALYNYYLYGKVKFPIPISDNFIEHYNNADADYILDLLGRAQSYE